MQSPGNIILIIVILTALCYGIHMLLFTWGWFRLKDYKGGRWHDPISVTVLIAARNEEKSIAGILVDLASQNYPVKFLEVLVLDDHSEDNTAALVQKFISLNKTKNIRLIHCGDEVRSKKQAIRLGLEQAKGRLIITTDADCTMGSRWVSAFVTAYEQNPVKLISGPVTYLSGHSFSATFQNLEFLGLVASGAGAIGAGFPIMCNGACMAYEKEAFIKVGGYDENEKYVSGDDVFLLHKIKKMYGNKAITFLKNPDALVFTTPQPDIRSFFSQRIRWGSKSSAYRDIIAISTTLCVFLFNMALLASSVSAFFFPALLPPLLLLWGFKYLADLPLLLAISGFTGQRKLLTGYIIFQPLYVIYLCIAGIASLFMGFEWKGRKGK